MERFRATGAPDYNEYNVGILGVAVYPSIDAYVACFAHAQVNPFVLVRLGTFYVYGPFQSDSECTMGARCKV